MTPRLAGARLLVVKVGSALVADGANPRTAWLDGVAMDIAQARAAGTAVIVVTFVVDLIYGLVDPRLRSRLGWDCEAVAMRRWR